LKHFLEIIMPSQVSPSGSVLALGATLKGVLLPANPPSRTPPTYTVTNLVAGLAGDTSIQAIANTPMNLADGNVLVLGSVNVTAANNACGNGASVILDGITITVTVAQLALAGTTQLFLYASQPVVLVAGTNLSFGGYIITLTASTSLTRIAQPFTVPTLLTDLQAGTQAIVGDGQASLGTTTFTITNTALAALNATTMQLSTPVAKFYPAGTILYFTGALRAVTAVDVTIGTSATPVTVQPLAAAIASTLTATAGTTVFVQALTSPITANSTSTTNNLIELLGIEDLSEQGKSNLVSTRSMKSGLGNEQRVAMVDTTIPVAGFFNVTSLAHALFVRPAFRTSGEIYAEVYYPDGEQLSGAWIVNNLNRMAKLGDVIKYSFDLTAQLLPTYVAK
jgi:hypothetical protein